MKTIGKYAIEREIGRGAASKVYLATDTFSKQPVALKLLDLKGAGDANRIRIYRKLLAVEASLAGKLSHPHIVKVLDAVLEGEVNYIVMEYVEGGTLEQYGEIDNLLPISTVAEVIYKCCKALEFAAYQGVIHRDIKLANILLLSGTDIKISDFGAAALFADQTTTLVSGVGSPAYMSPEQVRETKLSHQTDIYSLGVVMYKLLTGRLPFDASNNASLIYNILNISPPPPSEYRPEISKGLDAIVLRAMEKDVVNRYQTWAEFSQDLVAFFGNVTPEEQKIFDTEKFDTLRSLAFFKNFSDVELWEVLRISEWRKVAQDERILRDGDEACSFYVIARGTVRVLKQGRLLSLLRRGDCFGEMAHLTEGEHRRSTDVVSKTKVVLIEIQPDRLLRATTDCRFQFNDAFLHLLVRRLSMANTRLSHLLADRASSEEE